MGSDFRIQGYVEFGTPSMRSGRKTYFLFLFDQEDFDEKWLACARRLAIRTIVFRPPRERRSKLIQCGVDVWIPLAQRDHCFAVDTCHVEVLATGTRQEVKPRDSQFSHPF